MWILIIFALILFVFGAFWMINDFEAGGWIIMYLVSGIVGFGSYLAHQGDIQKQYQKVCHESNYLVSPTVVHLSDNSGKLLKYISENSEKTIAIKNTEGNFFVPESLLFVDTCNNELKIKK